MNITRKPFSFRTSVIETVSPVAGFGNENAGAGVPSGSIVEEVRTILRFTCFEGCTQGCLTRVGPPSLLQGAKDDRRKEEIDLRDINDTKQVDGGGEC